jgi:ELWxxDGT repeat protein
VAGTLFFVANDGVHGAELWKSDGTSAGTKMVEDLLPASDAYLTSLTDVNGTLFFFRSTSSHELWKSDGTPAGTSLVKVVDPNESAYPYHGPLLVEGDTLYFQARNVDGNGGVWKSDGTPGGTGPVDFTDGALWMIKLNGIYYFSHGDDAHGVEVWRSDGTPEGTELVKDINTLPCTDGCDGTYSSEPDKPVMLNGVMYFTAYDSEFVRNLWRSDGTNAGTQVVAAFESGQPTVLGNKLLFAGDPPSEVDFELMRSDGTAAGTRLVKRISPPDSYFGSYPYELTRLGNRVYFTADTESNPFGYESDRELYRTDGTKAGTRLVLDIKPGGSAEPRHLKVVGTSLFFTADDGIHGRELWRLGP